jgi:hypothetical protein
MGMVWATLLMMAFKAVSTFFWASLRSAETGVLAAFGSSMKPAAFGFFSSFLANKASSTFDTSTDVTSMRVDVAIT